MHLDDAIAVSVAQCTGLWLLYYTNLNHYHIILVHALKTLIANKGDKILLKEDRHIVIVFTRIIIRDSSVTSIRTIQVI